MYILISFIKNDWDYKLILYKLLFVIVTLYPMLKKKYMVIVKTLENIGKAKTKTEIN